MSSWRIFFYERKPCKGDTSNNHANAGQDSWIMWEFVVVVIQWVNAMHHTLKVQSWNLTFHEYIFVARLVYMLILLFYSVSWCWKRRFKLVKVQWGQGLRWTRFEEVNIGRGPHIELYLLTGRVSQRNNFRILLFANLVSNRVTLHSKPKFPTRSLFNNE